MPSPSDGPGNLKFIRIMIAYEPIDGLLTTRLAASVKFLHLHI